MSHPGHGAGRVVAAFAAVAFLGAAFLAIAPLAEGATGSRCRETRATAAATARLHAALVSGRDLLGEQLVASAGGPTYDAVRRILAPIRYGLGRGGAAPTRSRAYYLAFAYPLSLYGDKAFALHVADGSQIVTRRADGPSLTLYVGTGNERYGSCAQRLGDARLGGRYLPILETTYVDAAGARYRQESFAGRVPGVGSFVSFVRLSVDARAATRGAAVVRLVASAGSRTRLVTDGGGAAEDDGVRYRIRGTAVIYAAWVHRPSRRVAVDERMYDRARRGVVDFWLSSWRGGPRSRCPSSASWMRSATS